MHELGIARDIMRTVGEHAAGRKVLSVDVEVGPAAGVAVDALDFCIAEVAREMDFGEPRITIREVPAVLKCSCGKEYETSDLLEPCPSCGGYSREMKSGLDILIKEAVFEDNPK
jgi:hydrogenase nickel incorporation protein HypA/HybF